MYNKNIVANIENGASSSNSSRSGEAMKPEECYKLSLFSLERLFKQLSSRNENEFPNYDKWWSLLIKLLCSLSYGIIIY